MNQTVKMVREIRQELIVVEDSILNHPYPQAIEAVIIPRDKLSRFVGEQHRIIGSDIGSLALMVSRCTIQRSRDYYLSLLKREEAAFKALDLLAKALDLTDQWLEKYSPSPDCQAYTHFLAWLASHGAPAQLAGAFLVNLPAWGANCGRIARALQDSYGLRSTDVEFLTLFSTPPEQFEQSTIEVIQEDLERGVPPREVHLAARFLQAYELLFWDCLYKQTSVDNP